MIVVPVYHTCADAERMATLTGQPLVTVWVRNAPSRKCFPGVIYAMPDKPDYNPTELPPELAYLLYTMPEIGHTGRYGLWQLDSAGATTYVGPWEKLDTTAPQRAVEIIHDGHRFGAGRMSGERVPGARPEFAMPYKAAPAGTASVDLAGINLDPTQGLARQLYWALRERILDGRLPAGTRLPGIASLAERLGMGRKTVERAFDKLRAEDYLFAVQGIGTYVNPQVAPQSSRGSVDTPVPLC